MARRKEELSLRGGAPNTNSSLNEAFDSKAVMDLAAGGEKAFGTIPSGHPDALGAAFAVNGKIQEVVSYPSPTLLRKIYGRFLASYAIQAAAGRKPGEAPTPEQVAAFMKEGGQKKREERREVDRDNDCRLTEFDKKAFCESRYRGKVVCAQWLAEPEGLYPGVPVHQQRQRQGQMQQEEQRR